MKKRILSFVLTLLMVASILPAPTYAVDVEMTTESDSVIGKEVKFTASYPFLWTDHTNVNAQVQATSSELPEVMVIVAVHQFSASTTLYQLDAAEGYTWPAGYPQADFDGKYWVESTKVAIRCDKCGEFGCKLSHENWCEICGKDDCGIDHDATKPTDPVAPEVPSISAPVTDSNGNIVTDANGNPLTITVQGDLPKALS